MVLKKLKATLVALLAVASVQVTLAQTNDASAVLSKLSAKYDSYRSISADFSLTNLDKSNKKTFSKNGSIYIEKNTNRFYIDLPGTYTMISNGKSLYTVLHNEKEVEITEIDETKQEITPINLFTFYKKGFNYSISKDYKESGLTLRKIPLKPKSTSNYAGINLVINKSDNTIKYVEIKNKSGDTQKYAISGLKPNVMRDASIFKVDKNSYKGYEFVDLR